MTNETPEGKEEMKYCPECGHETVIETVKEPYGTVEIERCDGLIEVNPDKPLEACTWMQELTPPQHTGT